MKTAQELASILETGSGLVRNQLLEAAAMLLQQAEQTKALKAATSRQEAKIKALRDSLTWALSNISEEHYGWPSDEDADAHNAAIAAAKETP